MTYLELMEEKDKITAARAELDEQEKKLDVQIKLASVSYAETLLKRICALGKQIRELGFYVIDDDYTWIDFEGLSLQREEAEQ